MRKSRFHILKTISILTAVLAVAALSMSGCDRASTNSSSDDRVKVLEAEIERLKTAPPPPPLPTGELTRELAAALLNKHLATRQVYHLAFKKGARDLAVRDGLVAQVSNYEPIYRFTQKGATLAQGLVNEGTQVSSYADAGFQLNSPIVEKVNRITGIALDAFPNFCKVHYETDYVFPRASHVDSSERVILQKSFAEKLRGTFAEKGGQVKSPDAIPTEALNPLTKYVYSGQQAEIRFQKFDDGWRVMSNEQ